jgi:hypothetical protein
MTPVTRDGRITPVRYSTHGPGGIDLARQFALTGRRGGGLGGGGGGGGAVPNGGGYYYPYPESARADAAVDAGIGTYGARRCYLFMF